MLFSTNLQCPSSTMHKHAKILSKMQCKNFEVVITRGLYISRAVIRYSFVLQRIDQPGRPRGSLGGCDGGSQAEPHND